MSVLYEMTLAAHAEAWWLEQGNPLPPRDSEAWSIMYGLWVEYAFSPVEKKG